MSVETVFQLGDDSLKSAFFLLFPGGIPGGGNATNVELRMDETFDPPEQAVSTYEIWHKGQKIPKTGGVEESPKEFTFNVRLDQQWQVYDDLNLWLERVFNTETGTPGSDTDTRTTMLIQSVDRANAPIKTIKFTGVKLHKIKITEFDHSNGEPIKLELSFIFLRMKVE